MLFIPPLVDFLLSAGTSLPLPLEFYLQTGRRVNRNRGRGKKGKKQSKLLTPVECRGISRAETIKLMHLWRSNCLFLCFCGWS